MFNNQRIVFLFELRKSGLRLFIDVFGRVPVLSDSFPLGVELHAGLSIEIEISVERGLAACEREHR